MPPYVYCECCQREISVNLPLPQVNDEIFCACGALLRLTSVTFEPVVTAALLRPPPDFDDDDLTPVEVPTSHNPDRKRSHDDGDG